MILLHFNYGYAEFNYDICHVTVICYTVIARLHVQSTFIKENYLQNVIFYTTSSTIFTI